MLSFLVEIEYSLCPIFFLKKYLDVVNETLLLMFKIRVTQIKTYSWDNAQVVLVGNKSDMQSERVVSYERGQHFANQLGS